MRRLKNLRSRRSLSMYSALCHVCTTTRTGRKRTMQCWSGTSRFQEAIKSGQLILAGRTKEPGDKTFGIAIFKASDEVAARAFMEADPTVSAGLMTAELHPFAVALEY